VSVLAGPFAGELHLASAYAGISLGGDDLLAGPPGAKPQDDFGTGADAPGSAGPVLPDGVYSGAFQGGDRVDSFRTVTNAGEKLKVVLAPADKLGLALDPLPTLPAPDAAARFVRMQLFDPQGTLRDSTDLLYPAQQAEVEIDADVGGPWSVVLARIDHLDEPAPYTLAVQHAPLVFLPGDGGLAGDAPSGCAGAVPMTGLALGALTPGDDADSYVAHLTAPGTLAATLTVPDPDGADLDLELRDAATCGGVLDVVSAQGKNFALPKGVPEDIVQTGLPAGDYVLTVRHANGADDYALAVAQVKPA
jgi:hypothetical protein